MQPDFPYRPPATFEPPLVREQVTNMRMGPKQILFSFKGRIPRRVFWLWVIIAMGSIFIAVSLLDPLMKSEGPLEIVGKCLTLPVAVVLIWVNLAIRVKRWHDHDKSWVWLLIGMIPYLGGLISFIFLGCCRGTIGPNRYGDDPT